MRKKVTFLDEGASVILVNQEQESKLESQQDKALKPIIRCRRKSLTKYNNSCDKIKPKIKQRRNSAKVIHYPTNVHEFWIDPYTHYVAEILHKEKRNISAFTEHMKKSRAQRLETEQVFGIRNKSIECNKKQKRILTQPTSLQSSKNQFFRVRCINSTIIKQKTKIFLQLAGHQYKPITCKFSKTKTNHYK